MLAELGGGAVFETRMWPYSIVMPTPDFDQDARFDAVAKPFHVQALVAEFAVEALVVAVLPRLARIDQGSVDLSEAGVQVALGTDAFFADMHGTNAAELPLMMKEGGLSSMEAILAGTMNAAKCCLLGDQVGTLEAGKLADILVVDGDPLADITVLQEYERITVFKQGSLVL